MKNGSINICAKDFGWTIEETDNAPIHTLSWILAINDACKGN
jgi:hypothetical protein